MILKSWIVAYAPRFKSWIRPRYIVVQNHDISWIRPRFQVQNDHAVVLNPKVELGQAKTPTSQAPRRVVQRHEPFQRIVVRPDAYGLSHCMVRMQCTGKNHLNFSGKWLYPTSRPHDCSEQSYRVWELPVRYLYRAHDLLPARYNQMSPPRKINFPCTVWEPHS